MQALRVILRHRAILLLLSMAFSIHLRAQILTTAVESHPGHDSYLELRPAGIWDRGIGEGFQPGTQSLGLSAGASYGLAVFGGREAHDLSLLSLSYGHMLGGVRGEGHWYRGAWELRAQLFGGAQFAPNAGWLVGLTPHLR